MHQLEPWQAAALKAMHEKKQEMITRAQEQIGALDEALTQTIQYYTEAAGLEGRHAVTNKHGGWCLVPMEEAGDETDAAES